MKIFLAFLGLFLSFLFAGTEAAYTIFNKIRLEIWKKQNVRFLKPLIYFQEKPEDFFSTILFGNNISNILATTFATVLLIKFMGEGAAWLLITVIILIAGEIVPKTLFRSLVNIIIRPVMVLIYGFFILFNPIIKFINVLVDAFLTLFKVKHESTRDFYSRDELQMLLKEGYGSGVIEKPEMKYINNILHFGSVKVKEAMTPRTELIAAPESVTLEELKNMFIRHNVMHIPVYKDNLDNVKGIVFLWALFNSAKDVESVITPMEMIPENISCAQLMHEFKQKNISVALVVDEYGGTAGLVTMDDLIDTMFGDFPEAFEEVPRIRALNDHTWLLDGRFPLDELNEILEIDFPEGDYETIAGLVLQKLGHIPKPGETAFFDTFRVVVTRASKHKVLEVKLIRNLQ
ncbi:MAG: HlyC/CorC family transporter [Calditrichaeota bacterium]|nr:HlyC/CorC family transporter [Calditrichota bacterium]